MARVPTIARRANVEWNCRGQFKGTAAKCKWNNEFVKKSVRMLTSPSQFDAFATPTMNKRIDILVEKNRGKIASTMLMMYHLLLVWSLENSQFLNSLCKLRNVLRTNFIFKNISSLLSDVYSTVLFGILINAGKFYWYSNGNRWFMLPVLCSFDIASLLLAP